MSTWFWGFLIVVVLWYVVTIKSRLGRKMSRLANAAQMTVFARLNQDAETDNMSADEKKKLSQEAAAACNFLFGKYNDQHAGLDLQRINKGALEWIGKDAGLCELVVQSLRVRAQVKFMRSRSTEIEGREILEAFGAQYLLAPNPGNYEALINREIVKLRPEDQPSIRRLA